MNQSNKLENFSYIVALFDIYKDLLTTKQKEYFISYYFEDLSLAEISNIHNISRNAILDSNKKTIAILQNYEDKLKLFATKKQIYEILTKNNDADIIKKQIQQIDLFKE